MLKKRSFSDVRTVAVLAVAMLLLVGVSSVRAYQLNNLGLAGGWDDVQKGSVSYVLDRSDYTSDLGMSESQITGALSGAFDTWSSRNNSSLSLRPKRDRGGNYDVLDGPADSSGPPWFGGYAGDSLDQGGDYGYADIVFGGWLNNSYFDYLEDGSIDGVDSSILAVCWTGEVSDSIYSEPRWIAEIFFNDGYTWSTDGGGYDIETVMLHELGHAIGLGHEETISPSVMNP